MSSTQNLSSSQTRAIIGLIMDWLGVQLTTDAFMWLSKKMMRLKMEPSDKQFNTVFKLIPQRLGTNKLFIDNEDLISADSHRKGWKPVNWRLDEAARIAIMLNAAIELSSFISCIEKILQHSNENEVIAIYKGLPLFPDPQQYLPIAINALEEDRKPVLAALIQNNPYPFENLDETMWQKMIAQARSLEIVLEPTVDPDLKTMNQ